MCVKTFIERDHISVPGIIYMHKVNLKRQTFVGFGNIFVFWILCVIEALVRLDGFGLGKQPLIVIKIFMFYFRIRNSNLIA